MRAVQWFSKLLVIVALFLVSFSTRLQEVTVEEGDGSFELRSGNFVAGFLALLFIPAFSISLLALYHALRKDPSRWTVRSARYLDYLLVLSAHLSAFHLGQWNAVFNPIAILLEASADLTLRVICSGMALSSLAATLPALYSFLYAGPFNASTELKPPHP